MYVLGPKRLLLWFRNALTVLAYEETRRWNIFVKRTFEAYKNAYIVLRPLWYCVPGGTKWDINQSPA